MRTARVGLAMFLLAFTLGGCALFGGGNGGVQPLPVGPSGLPIVLEQLIVQYGGAADINSGWHSPTAEPGMEMYHVAAMTATTLIVNGIPQAKAFCETEVGAMLLLKVANGAACPVSKGCLMAGGWLLIEYYKPDPPQGYIGRKYYAQKGSQTIGKP